jgi:hypothetical protein
MEAQRLDLTEFSSAKRVETTVRMASYWPCPSSSQRSLELCVRYGWGMKPLVNSFGDELPGLQFEVSRT